MTSLCGPQVDLGDYTFNADPDPSCPNQLWVATTPIEGWHSADVRRSTAPRLRADGTWLVESQYAERTLDLSGSVKYDPGTDTEEDVLEALEDCFDCVRASVELRVAETTPKVMQVRRTGAALLRPATPRLIEFQVPLAAIDPLKYAESPTNTVVATSGVVAGGGTAPSYPTITVAPAGSLTPPWGITSSVYPGFSIGIQGLTLTNPDVLVIDTRTMTITLNGADAFQYLGSASTRFPIDPGNQTLTASKAMTFTVGHTDAWI